MKTVLAFGAGVDSTAMLLMHLFREKSAAFLGITLEELAAALPPLDAAAMADPGAEWPATYQNAQRASQACAKAGLEYVTVRKGEVPNTGRRETITDWILRLGIVPLMPGSSHVCSLKFKGEVLQAWAKDRYDGEKILWLVGIESEETCRVSRFTARDTSGESLHSFAYPLVTLGMNREKCEALIAYLGWPKVHKSSCRFCPFMQDWEIEEAVQEEETYELLVLVEGTFRLMSKVKNDRWIENGQPLNSAGRAPKGMWRKNSWEEGARLFAKRVDGKQKTVQEWREEVMATK